MRVHTNTVANKARIYVIGFNSQSRIDKVFDTIPTEYNRILLDNGDTKLTAPDGVEYHRIVETSGLFTDALRHCILDNMDHNAIPIVLNDDLILEPGCIENLLVEIEAGAGIAVPMQVSMKNPGLVIYGGSGAAYPAGMHIRGNRDDRRVKHRKVERWSTFCAVAINPELVKEIGLPDKNLAMWFSDSDYCIRARLAGYTCVYQPKAVVQHEDHAATEERDVEWRRVRFTQDRTIFARKWGGYELQCLSR